jgi:hypothetical protein
MRAIQKLFRKDHHHAPAEVLFRIKIKQFKSLGIVLVGRHLLERCVLRDLEAAEKENQNPAVPMK